MPVASILPKQHLSPGASIVGAFGVSALLPIVVLFYLFARRRQLKVRGKQADASVDDALLLVAGPTVLHGRVEMAAGSQRALRVDIEQLGTEWKHKGRWHHRWSEKARRVEANAFYLRTDAGKRIRVEPTNEVRLVDEMDQTSPLSWRDDGVYRMRTAELTKDEVVFAVGELAMANDPEAPTDYRGAGRALVLRKPERATMLLSSEPLGAAFRRRAFILGMWMWIFVFAMAVFQAFLIPYHARLFLGDTTKAEVVGKRRWVTTNNKGRKSHHWAVRLKLPSGDVFEDKIAGRDWRGLERGHAVYAQTVPGWPSIATVGSRASIPLAYLVFSTVAFPLLGMGIWLHLRASRPWYERPLIEKDTGRLPTR